MKTLRFYLGTLAIAASLLGTSSAQTAPAPSATPTPSAKGGDPTDPRASLKPGVYDAGEAISGLEHVIFLKKPDVFQLKASSPDDPVVSKTLTTLGMSQLPPNFPPAMKLVIAGLAFANSDFAFQGNHLFQGNFYGVDIFDIADPAKTKLLTTLVCPGGQGDVSVYGNLLFMSVEMSNGRLDCGTQGFAPPPPPPAPKPGEKPAETHGRGAPPADPARFRGVRIFDISDIKNPKQVAAVQSCRGSHTHTLLVDPNDKDNVYIYISGTSFVRPAEELAGCSAEAPDKDPNTSLFRIDVIKVPLAHPEQAAIVSSPRVFLDAATGHINGISNGGSHGEEAGKEDKNAERPRDTNQCHDITVYSAIGLAAGACSGNGILLNIKDPIHPVRVEAVNDPNYSYWHSASFSNDGSKVVFTDEWGGGMQPNCKASSPLNWGADAIFNLSGNKLSFASYYKMPAAQGDTENCVAHNGSLVPVPGRDIEVQSWYQGGVSVMDFTDASKPFEIAYFDRGAIDPKNLVLGGYWSTYWYNGYIYGSEIARGLDVFKLTPSKFLTQNEIDAANTIKFATLNVQNQQKIEWPNKLIVAKAYIDQLERSEALSADQLTGLRKAIDDAEKSKLKKKQKAKLATLAATLDPAGAKTPADSARLTALSAILKNPVA